MADANEMVTVYTRRLVEIQLELTRMRAHITGHKESHNLERAAGAVFVAEDCLIAARRYLEQFGVIQRQGKESEFVTTEYEAMIKGET